MRTRILKVDQNLQVDLVPMQSPVFYELLSFVTFFLQIL